MEHGLVVKTLDSKPIGGYKIDSVFHASEVDQMSTRNFQGT